MSGTVSVTMLRAIFATTARMGVDVAPMMAELGLDDQRLAEPDGRLPVALSLQAWRLCAERTGDPFFGLHLAERFPVGVFDVVEHAAAASPDVGEAIRRVCRFQAILDDSIRVEIEREDGRVCIVQRHDIPEALWVRHASEAFFALFLRRGRDLVGRPWSPLEMRFRHAAPPDVSEHARVFGCALRFSQTMTAMVVAPELLDMPFRAADPSLGAVLTRYADSLLARLPANDDTATRVQRVLASELRHGCVSPLEDVARQLGMSARTLQRRLADQGTSHKDVLDGVRRELASGYVGGDLGFEEVAFLLGFSELSAFYRAFKRWTGCTPAEERRRRRAR